MAAHPSVIITDLDETLYSWVDYFAPSFRAMVHVLARETGESEDALYSDFRRIYTRKGSLEYAFSVQELEFCQTLEQEELSRLVRLARGAFRRVREKNLVCYPGVKETLTWARREHIQVIGITNAPLFQALRRLAQLRIDHLIDGLAAWEGYDVPDSNEETRLIQRRVESGSYKSRVPLTWSLTDNERKPSSLGYKRILEEIGSSATQYFVVGDNLQKDIAPAMDLGAIGIWARYGRNYKKDNWDTLLRITHWDEQEVDRATSNTEDITPDYYIDNFAELMILVPPPQMRLVGFE